LESRLGVVGVRDGRIVVVVLFCGCPEPIFVAHCESTVGEQRLVVGPSFGETGPHLGHLVHDAVWAGRVTVLP
jgi:hypothetical protein